MPGQEEHGDGIDCHFSGLQRDRMRQFYNRRMARNPARKTDGNPLNIIPENNSGGKPRAILSGQLHILSISADMHLAWMPIEFTRWSTQ